MLTLENLINITPYPGLRSFESSERQYFFGRERQLDELLRKLRSNRFLAVVGTAGSGKSSLVKASLLPRLKDGFSGQAGQNWRIAVCNIGTNPIGNLAKQLAQRGVLHADSMMDPNYPAIMEQLLRRGSLGIVEAYKQANVNRENLMIVVDQFGDIFRLAETGQSEEAAAFVSLLLNASRQKDFPIYIVLTMRSSDLGLCTEFRGLPEAINDGQFMLPRMKMEDLKKVIIAPAMSVDSKIEVDPSLVNTILDEATEDFDELAVLQHTMMRTWEYWISYTSDYEKDPISISHYKAIGGLNFALDRHAEEAFAEVVARDDEDTYTHQHICERMFRGLAEIGPEGKHIRRPMTVKEIMNLTGGSFQEVRFVINAFAQKTRQFIYAPSLEHLEMDSTINVAHDSLLTRWKRLATWLKDEVENSALFIRIANDAALYNEGKGSLYTDPELTIGLKWAKPHQFDIKSPMPEGVATAAIPAIAPTLAWSTRYHPGFTETIKFLEASENARNAAFGRVEYEQNRRMRSATLLAAGGALFGLVCILLLGVTLIASEKANRNATLAYRSAQEAQRSRYLAEINRQNADEKTALAKIKEKLALAERMKAENATIIAQAAADDAARSARIAEVESARAQLEAKRATEARLLAEQRTIEAKEAQKEAEEAKEIAETASNEALRVKGLSLAQAVAVKSLDVTEVEVEALLARESYGLNKALDGAPYDAYIYKALYEANENLNSRFNSLNTAPEGVKRIGTIRSIIVNNDKLYTTGSEGYILQWKNQTFEKYKDRFLPANLPQIVGSKSAVSRAMVMTKDGQLVVGGDGGNLEVFNPEVAKATPKVIKQLGASPITAIALMPTQKAVVFATVNGSIQYADLGASESKIVAQTLGKVVDIALSYDGKYLFAVGHSSQPIILDLSEGGKKLTSMAETFNINQNNVIATSVALSPNGQYLSIGYSDGILRIWDFQAKETKAEIRIHHTASIQDIVFSNDSRMMGVASMDKSATLWQLSDGKIQPYKKSDYVPIKLTKHDDWVMSVAFSNDGSRFYTGTQNGVVKIWETNMQLYADEICKRVSKNLSDKLWLKYIGTDDPNNKQMYLALPKGGRRTPLSTCGGGVDQMPEN